MGARIWRRYYTLTTFEGGKWCAQFGDYERKVVAQEALDNYHGERLKIICTGDSQAQIDASIATLNQ